MSFESEIELSALTDKEANLTVETTQLVSRLYENAAQHNTPALPYLQGYASLAPEPTVAFRLDSKTTYSVETNKPNIRKLIKEHYIVHVPELWARNDTNVFVDKFWFMRNQADGTSELFEAGEEGARPYRPAKVLEAELGSMYATEDLTPVQIEFNFADLLMAGIREKSRMIQELELFKRAMNGEFVLVDWNS